MIQRCVFVSLEPSVCVTWLQSHVGETHRHECLHSVSGVKSWEQVRVLQSVDAGVETELVSALRGYW